MKNELIDDIIQGMLPYLDNAQLKHLNNVLQKALSGYDVILTDGEHAECDVEMSNQTLLSSFLSAKRIEGCSDNTLRYYRKTIEAMLSTVGKSVSHIVTDELRQYLTDYQSKNNSSKVTIDNIRRILSSFFAWLEDED